MFINGELGAGRFLKRPNRFLALLETRSGERKCHVRDPGRLNELLRPGAVTVFLEKPNPRRKTDCELLVWSGRVWTVVNSGLHSELAQELLESGFLSEFPRFTSLRREVRHGDSRIDFLLESLGRRVLLEVKGCTLVRDGVALFPDAPTERGRRHILNVIRAVEGGYEAAILFLVMRPDAEYLSPNVKTDPSSSRALKKAEERGVRMYAVAFAYRSRSIDPVSEIPVVLQ